MTATHAVTRELRSLLRTRSAGVGDRWRKWSDELMRPGRLTPALLASVWTEVLDFDPVLNGYVNSPVPMRDKPVIVAGSGKETFKTFNISTAASLLAASTGVPVVKGVSTSVSAVSGAADVLDSLGIPTETHPATVTEAVESDGIAFISYAAFCPTYAGRYDGIFPVLSPFSFFMPAAVLAIDASRFLFGLAHTDVHLAAATLRIVRPGLHTGYVVATEIGPSEVMDEWADIGTTYKALVRNDHIELSEQLGYHESDATWRNVVGHHNHHAANARAVVDAVSPTGQPARVRLVEHNAALIVRASHDDEIAASDALAIVRDARRNGRALGLLEQLQHRRDRPRSCAVS